jgi:hypothetical protein
MAGTFVLGLIVSMTVLAPSPADAQAANPLFPERIGLPWFGVPPAPRPLPTPSAPKPVRVPRLVQLDSCDLSGPAAAPIA